MAATEMRPPSRISRNWWKPFPRSPSRLPSGTCTSLNESSRVSDARQPRLRIGGEREEPWHALPPVAERVALGHVHVLERELAGVRRTPAELAHRRRDLVAGR